MTFAQAVATQPQWVQIWVNILGLVIFATAVVLLFSRATRRDAIIIFLTMAATIPGVLWLFDQLGYVRLLGVVHVVLWTPLAIYLMNRLRDPAINTPFRQVIWVFLVAIGISLAFDYVDTARYVLGEQDSMVPQAAQ